jgi:hypothetical protein
LGDAWRCVSHPGKYVSNDEISVLRREASENRLQSVHAIIGSPDRYWTLSVQADDLRSRSKDRSVVPPYLSLVASRGSTTCMKYRIANARFSNPPLRLL